VTEYVTLVPQGGQPVRLGNQTGAPWPTTGSGSLVFSDSPTLTNATLINPTITPPTAPSILSPPATGDAIVDTANLTIAFAESARTGETSVLSGEYFIGFEQVVWFYWYNSLANPVYGAVPIVSGMSVDATDATFRYQRADWMPSNPRTVMFYSPGFSTSAGRLSNIKWRGGTFNFARTGVTETPSQASAFGLVGVDDFTVENARFIGADGERRGRGGFMLNCRKPRILNCSYKNMAQGHYLAFADDGHSFGLSFENLAEGIDFDLPCRGWIVTDTFAKSLSEQVWDGGSIDQCLFDGLCVSDTPNVMQLYTKPEAWQTFSELWDHLGSLYVTFNTTVNTITFGSVVEGAAEPINPVIANGSHVGLNVVGTLPTGLAPNTLYYLINVSGRTAQLSLTEGGSAIDMTGSPTSNNTATFYPTDLRICDKITISGVRATDMIAAAPIVQVSNLRQSGNFYLGGGVQCRDITLYDWQCEGGGLILINEGTNIIVDMMTLENCRPARDEDIGFAFVARESTKGGSYTTNSYLSLKVSRLTIDGSTQGGVLINGAAELSWDDVKVSGYVGEEWVVDGVTYDTRYGVAMVRAGSKAGAILTVGKTDILEGPDDGTDFAFSDVNIPAGSYTVSFDGPFNFASNLTATGVTPCDVGVKSNTTRNAISKTLVVPFDDSVNTTATTKTKFAASDLETYIKVLSCSVKTLDAIAPGSGGNGSAVKLVRRVAGVANDIVNGVLRLDSNSGVAADAERYMPMGSNEANSTTAPGETLVAKIVAAGTGGTSPPCALNLAVLKYTSV